MRNSLILVCPLCNKQFKSITNSHLKKEHGLTTPEFLALTGWETICSKETIERNRSNHLDVYNSPLLGKIGDSELAVLLKCSRRLVTRAREKQNIPPPKLKYKNQEGAYLRSALEAMYDCYLHELGIAHEHEVHVPNSNFVSDFKVGDLYIEVRGMENYQNYEAKQGRKEDHYTKEGLKVVWIYPGKARELFSYCSKYEIICLEDRACSLCEKFSTRMVKGMCPSCYGKVKGREKSRIKEEKRLSREGPRPKSISQIYRDFKFKAVSFSQFYIRYERWGWTAEDAAQTPSISVSEIGRFAHNKIREEKKNRRYLC